MNDTPPDLPVTPVRVATAACPVCGKPVEPRYRPFCSKRCADVDLNRWFGENYRVETSEEPTEDPA
ncbi:DNA gyrase inhibitor YacG [Insolitispirillum peregrinum]|uniref:DNA gyrase inhibitor YacG n=1 Tax=Insolitispirillum peregrinum TaxID=80876 RepID=A0A1N7P812_9PROT|nr:DNA gyrase inhibitor YacG [Insolitispirillum peregrinum]SIT06742.1 hypothetical protein SAMN05421779_106135 [Insolitispirillum peregrinum]